MARGPRGRGGVFSYSLRSPRPRVTPTKTARKFWRKEFFWTANVAEE